MSAGMIPWELWQKALWSWATAVTGRSVIWADQDANVPPPKRPYVVLSVPGVRKVGEDGIHYTYDSTQPNGQQLLEQRYGTRRVRVNISVFARSKGQLGESAMSIGGSLLDSFGSRAQRQVLTDAGLGFSEAGEVKDLTSIDQIQFAGQSSLDVIFEAAAFTPLDQAPKGQVIDRVVGTGDLEGNSAPELTFDVTG